MESDAELVKASLDGQKRAFETLIRRYERPVRAAALGVLGDYHRAQDAAQEAFVRAYERLGQLRRKAAFGPWLMKIARRCALNIAMTEGGTKNQVTKTIVAVIEKPDGQLDDEKRRLLSAVLKLPVSERQVIMLRYFGGHTAKDVAAVVGRSIGTVTKQISRAHKRLRAQLERAQR